MGQYNARDEEVERYAEEIGLYDKETGLQYTPKDKETKFIAKHMPIMLDGEATGDEEVSGFRDLERVDTNSARGGMCLVMAEGIALKAPKIQRYTRNLDEIDWPWLQDLIDGNYADNEGEGEENDDTAADDEDGDGDESGEADDASDDSAGPPRVEESQKFLRDLIAGRPVFSHPCAKADSACATAVRAITASRLRASIPPQCTSWMTSSRPARRSRPNAPAKQQESSPSTPSKARPSNSQTGRAPDRRPRGRPRDQKRRRENP